MNTPLYLIDAFSDHAFAGNPAAVCFLDAEAPAAWMQAVAMEMNQSETAFLWPLEDRWSLRWFTPTVEVDLCGHATLASAHALWHEIGRKENTLRFETRSGELLARQQGDWIELEFPVDPVQSAAVDVSSILAPAAQTVLLSREDLIVVIEQEQDIRALQPNLAALAELPYRCMVVTALSQTAGVDCVSRVFGPRVGIDEDPVTGSVHMALYDYWSQRLQQDELIAYQASKRGGVLQLRQQGERVLIAGQATTVIRGTLNGD